MVMTILDESVDRIRSVYNYEKEDPFFDNFYRGLGFLVEGRFEESQMELMAATEGKNFTPAFKYLMAAMVESGCSEMSLYNLSTAWMIRAHTDGTPDDVDVASSAAAFIADRYRKEPDGVIKNET